jgi:hypothetical protein
LGIQDHKAQLVLEFKARKDQVEIQAHKDLQAHKDHKDHKALLAQWDLLVVQVHKVHKVLKVLKVRLVLEFKARKDHKALQVLATCLGHKDHKALGRKLLCKMKELQLLVMFLH